MPIVQRLNILQPLTNHQQHNTGRLHPFGSRHAIRSGIIPQWTCRTRLGRPDESPWQSLRQRQSEEFHEDAEVRGGLSVSV